MIQTAELLSSVSRKSGGLFYSVRRLAQSVERLGVLGSTVYSLEDEFSHEDARHWSPLKPRVFGVRGPKSFGYSPALKHELLSSQAALLHSHGMWMFPSSLALQWRRLKGKPSLLSPHGMLDPWALRRSPFKKLLARFLYEDEHLRRCDCLRSLCDSETRSMRALGLTQPICRIPNGVDIPGPDGGAPPPWGRLGKRRVLLFLGRIHPKKGLEALLRAFAGLKAGSNEWSLAVAGWDQEGHEERLKGLAARLGLEGRVLFTGPLFNSAKDAAFRHASAFVLPSLSEGLPVAVLEAWSYGLPVLMSSACNLEEGFDRLAAQRIADEEGGLGRSLEGFLSLGEKELQEMGARGLSLVKEKFAWDGIAKDMLAVYLWLLQAGPKPACVTP
jgi:poly(glycerol-phosphate) alpha-glucosyltransferase